jgi:hypothetical protein
MVGASVQPVKKLYISVVGPQVRGIRPGELHVLLPTPIDRDAGLAAVGFSEFAEIDTEWDAGFDRIVDALLAALTRRFGPPDVIAPRRRDTMTWWQRWRARHPHDPKTITNPLSLSPRDALLVGVHDVGAFEFVSVVFASGLVTISTWDERPVLWVWLDREVLDAWPELTAAAAGELPCETIELQWDRLLPDKPVLSVELPRAMVHRTETASWSNGEHTLGFQAAMGVRPAEVYVPTRERWATAAPEWAQPLRETIVRELAALGVRVVELPDAPVFDNYRRIGIDY